MAFQLAQVGKTWQEEARKKMPEARGDLRELVDKPVFVPLYMLFRAYGGIFRLSFGPKTFVVVSDPAVVRQILLTNAEKYSKGLLSEILGAAPAARWGRSCRHPATQYSFYKGIQPTKDRDDVPYSNQMSMHSPNW